MKKNHILFAGLIVLMALLLCTAAAADPLSREEVEARLAEGGTITEEERMEILNANLGDDIPTDVGLGRDVTVSADGGKYRILLSALPFTVEFPNSKQTVELKLKDTWMEVPHAHGGLVPGDGMGLMAQHFFGTKRGTYYMMTARQWTAQQMLDWEDIAMSSYPLYTADDTEIKMLARGNPAVVYVQKGIIRWKRTLTSIDASKLRNPEQTLTTLNDDNDDPDGDLMSAFYFLMAGLALLLVVNRTHLLVLSAWRRWRKAK